MAAIFKVPLPSGASRWEARIKSDGQQIAKKRFTTKAAATAWSKRIEGDQEMVTALGYGGAALKFSDLAKQYIEQWTGKAHSRVGNVEWWADQFGDTRVMDITRRQIKELLDRYAQSPIQIYVGREKGERQWSGSRGELHPSAPTDPYVTVSRHTALVALISWQPVSPIPNAQRTWGSA